MGDLASLLPSPSSNEPLLRETEDEALALRPLAPEASGTAAEDPVVPDVPAVVVVAAAAGVISVKGWLLSARERVRSRASRQTAFLF